MKNRLPVIVAGIVAVALIGFVIYRLVQKPAAAPAVASQNEDAEEQARRNVPRVEPEKLLADFQAGSVTIIDVRDAEGFAQQHIPGAKHVPLAQVESMAPYLPKTKPIVAYCT
jgi:3-mercaptopyruvate sulfurtransferase SseA